MTDEERKEEGAEEVVEDLDAPGEVQREVAGGKCYRTLECLSPTKAQCLPPTCIDTKVACIGTKDPVVFNE